MNDFDEVVKSMTESFDEPDEDQDDIDIKDTGNLFDDQEYFEW
jgi:hypothetical protein